MQKERNKKVIEEYDKEGEINSELLDLQNR